MVKNHGLNKNCIGGMIQIWHPHQRKEKTMSFPDNQSSNLPFKRILLEVAKVNIQNHIPRRKVD